MSAVSDDRRVRRALRDALNGDVADVDPAVRRGLFVLAVATDDLEDRFNRIERRITSATVSIVVALLTSSSGIIWALVR